MADDRNTPRTAKGSDPLSSAQRSRNMSGIRARDTKPEMLIRRGLHGRGFRYRLHDASLPGRPDMVFQGRRAVIQINGCFWHGHDCPKGVTPAANADFWIDKIERNRARDQRTTDALLRAGWRVLTVWECALRGRARWAPAEVFTACEHWLNGAGDHETITGRWSAVAPQEGSLTTPGRD